jgi:hypothetical protein
MKNILMLVSCLLLIFGILLGCQSKPKLESEEPNTQFNSKTEETPAQAGDSTTQSMEELPGSTENDTKNFAIYELENPDSPFNRAILDNPIDMAYQEEISKAETSQEMIQVEQKYLRIWEAELDNAAVQYTEALSAEDTAAFTEAKRLFSAYTTASFSYDLQIIREESYDIHLGTLSVPLLYARWKEAVKERTVYVKYMHYILERSAGAEAYTSMLFCFNNT